MRQRLSNDRQVNHPSALIPGDHVKPAKVLARNIVQELCRAVIPVLSGVLLSAGMTPAAWGQSPGAGEWWKQCQQEWRAGQFTIAEQSCLKALTLYREVGDRQAEATVLSGLGVIYSSLRQAEKAIAYQLQGLEAAKLSQNTTLVVKAWLNLGQAYETQPDAVKAIAAYEEGLQLARKTQFAMGTVTALNFLAHAYAQQHDLAKVVFYQEQSIPLARQLKDERSEVRSRINLGNAYTELGRGKAAIAVLEPGITIAQQQGWSSELAWIHQKLGGAYRIQGQYTQAIASYEQSLTTARTAQNRDLEIVALNESGRVYEAQGNYAKAIEFHQTAYDLAKRLNQLKHQIRSLNGLGLAHYNLGNFEQTIALQTQQLQLAQQGQDSEGQSWALSLLGLTYSAQGHYPKGLEYLQQAAKLMQQGSDRWGTAAVLANLGGAYRNQGDYAQAIRAYEQSLALVRSLNSPAAEGRVLISLGSVYRNQKLYPQAIAAYQQGLVLTRQVRDDTATSYALTNLGLIYYWQQNLQQSETWLRQAIASRESLRTRMGNQDALKIALADMEITQLAYLNLQRTLIAQKRFEAALEIAEQGRARTFAELIAKNIPGYQAAPLPLPTLAQIRQVAKAQNATLVQYSILDDSRTIQKGSQQGDAQIAIWLVQPTGQIAFRQVSLTDLVGSEEKLTELVNNGRGKLHLRSKPRLTSQHQGLSQFPMQALYQLLIHPIADLLPTQPEAKVVFMPQGSLFLVPFAALQTLDGHYLIERHTVVVSPSIQVLDLTRQAKQKWQTLMADGAAPFSPALVVGNPTMPNRPSENGQLSEPLSPLPGSEAEAKAIANLIKTQAITGDTATKAFVLQQLQQARLVHLATHGLLEDVQKPGIPGTIALAPTASDSGFLSAAELLTLNLRADLVVLSACHTGQGRITGDGVVGLSRSLIAAGTPSIIVSLWAVPDASTEALMVEFYRQLLKHPDKAQALRQAMLITLQKYPSPIDWASFILIGES